jgi:hypothetical protein
LHPAADPGVRRVSGRDLPLLAEGGETDLPRRRGSYPSEVSSSPTAAPCHHGRCLLAVTEPATAFAVTGRPDFEALLHRRVRFDQPPLPVAVVRASPGLRSPSRCLPSTSFRYPCSPPHRPRTGEDGRPDDPPVARLSRLGPKPETFPATGRGCREPGSGTCHPSRRRPARAGGRERSPRPVAARSAASRKGEGTDAACSAPPVARWASTRPRAERGPGTAPSGEGGKPCSLHSGRSGGFVRTDGAEARSSAGGRTVSTHPAAHARQRGFPLIRRDPFQGWKTRYQTGDRPGRRAPPRSLFEVDPGDVSAFLHLPPRPPRILRWWKTALGRLVERRGRQARRQPSWGS